MGNNNKIWDAYKAPTLIALIQALNKDGITKEDVVSTFYGDKEFVAIIYK